MVIWSEVFLFKINDFRTILCNTGWGGSLGLVGRAHNCDIVVSEVETLIPLLLSLSDKFLWEMFKLF